MSSPSAVRVFISYSHDSADHAEKVLQLADKLREDGIDAWIDQYEPVPAQGWPRWMEAQVERELGRGVASDPPLFRPGREQALPPGACAPGYMLPPPPGAKEET